MKKTSLFSIYLITAIFLLCSNAYCQNKIKITVTNKQNIPLPFASIAYLNNEIGGSTDTVGQITIKKIIKDTLKISCVGYKPEFLVINDETNNQSVILEEQPKLLDDIVITNQKKKYKSNIWLGYPFLKNDPLLTSETMNTQEAVFIKNEKKISGFVNIIKFKLYYLKNKNFLLRIRLRTIDTTTMLPAADLLLSNNIINPSQLRHINKMNIKALKIKLPEEGIFASYEWIPNYPNATRNDLPPLFEYTPYQPDGYVLRNYNETKWYKVADNKKGHFGKSVPNISIEVSY